MDYTLTFERQVVVREHGGIADSASRIWQVRVLASCHVFLNLLFHILELTDSDSISVELTLTPAKGKTMHGVC